MKIIILFPLSFAVIITANLWGTVEKVYSPQLESKIYKEQPGINGEEKYVGSLQLNGSHICSSCLYKEDILLTTGQCAWQIENGMKHKDQKATVVFSHPSWEFAQRIDIWRIAFHPRFRINNESRLHNYCDLAVIQLVHKVDRKFLEPLEISLDRSNLNHMANNSLVCGWGTGIADHQGDNIISTNEHSHQLHCMPVMLFSIRFCKSFVIYGDFKDKLLCGKSLCLKKITTMGDVGGPLTEKYKEDDEYKTRIIGITLQPHIYNQNSLFRFIRASYVYLDIKKMLKKLKDQSEASVSCSKIEKEENLTNKPNKMEEFPYMILPQSLKLHGLKYRISELKDYEQSMKPLCTF